MYGGLHSRYRPDIDGLRAIAILSVLLFHFDVAGVGGGFAGVDVFFVISGFLITRLIRDEVLETGAFSFSNFYLRRARRIFPALFFTLCLSFVAAFLCFAPQHLELFGGSLVHAALMVSNVYFWRESGYFDADAEFKPLLHTWSLSVEEQFYLVWPVLLVLLLRKAPRRSAPAALVLGIAASLALNLVFADGSAGLLSRLPPAVGSWFADGQATIFYLAPFRGYELALGALVVWLVRFQPKNKLALEPLVLAGLGMIGYAVFAFTKETPFPSYNALLPCGGAALVIYGGTARHSGRLLSNPLAVGVGLISYSLYLVHWPIVVFTKYLRSDTLTGGDQLLVGAASLCAALLMYRFVEKPFRLGRSPAPRWPPARFGLACALLTLALLLPAASAWLGGGWVWRFPKALVEQLNFKTGHYHDYVWQQFKAVEGRFAGNGKPKVLVVGNSQAADFVNVLAESGATGDVDLATIAMVCQAVFPLPDAVYRERYGKKADFCREQHAKVMASGLLAQAETVILVTTWADWSLDYLDSTVRFLKGKGVRRVGVVGGKLQTMDGIKFLARYGLRGNPEQVRTPRHEANARLNERISRAGADIFFVDLLDYFCDAAGCRRMTPDGHLIILDRNHFTPSGARLVGAAARGSAWLRGLAQPGR
jgi:peptidoglycan/LPS O-acetylase OafA/YrhL